MLQFLLHLHPEIKYTESSHELVRPLLGRASSLPSPPAGAKLKGALLPSLGKEDGVVKQATNYKLQTKKNKLRVPSFNPKTLNSPRYLNP
jgi:hypothetical protein